VAGMIRPASARPYASAVCGLGKRFIGRSHAFPRQPLAQLRSERRPAASAFNESRALPMGVKFLVLGNGNEQHDLDGSSAI